jgi:hypothetical protein
MEVTPMRRLFQVILIVLTISFSAFLIERSCHEDPGRLDPNRPGGITQAIRPPVINKAPITASASPTAQLDEEHPSKELAAKEKSSPEPRDQSPAVAAATAQPRTKAATAEAVTASIPSPGPEAARADEGVHRIATTGTETTARAQRANAARADVANEAKADTARVNAAATEKLQGTWVLRDERNTKLELTVVNNTGVVKAYIPQVGRPVTVQQRVTLLASGDTVYVYGSDRGMNARAGAAGAVNEPIVLAFVFKADGSTQVIWQRNDSRQSYALNVVSHTR